MSCNETAIMTSASDVSRRSLFSILPTAAAGCLGCARAAHSWTEKAGMTWEEIFQFAFQKDLIPILKGLSAQIGSENLLRMLREISDWRVAQGIGRRAIPKRDLASFAAGIKFRPPLFQHALAGEIIEDTPQVFAYRVTKCLWAKAFREEDAGDIGYAMVCYPDYAVARAFNPKLKLIRTKTLMQGQDSCSLRYVMES